MTNDPVFQANKWTMDMEANVGYDIDGNPIKLIHDKWYFWNEVWADAIGPYDTEQEARENLKEYGEGL